MDMFDLVDPELRPLLDMWPTTLLTRENLAAVRADQDALPMPRGRKTSVRLEVRDVPGHDGAPAVQVHLFIPENRSSNACVYHIHGGGYVVGSVKRSSVFMAPLAETLGCIIASVDYRLAPETIFPGPVEDCYAGLGWLHDHAKELGIDPARIGVMGESAGGGLAAGLALLTRDRGAYSLAFQLLIYPMIDDRTCTADPHPFTGHFVWTAAHNHFGWSSLLGCEPGVVGVSQYAAAARAEDLSGLPPTFISTGALDLFLEEDLEFARRLMRAGVPTELHVYPGAYHGFELAADAEVARQASSDKVAALMRFTRTSAT